MIQAIIFNISVTIASFYLYHRIQYSETRTVKFSQNYITILMTGVSILLISNPIQYHDYVITLSFIPLLFLGRFTNLFYTSFSAVIILLVDMFIFNTPFLDDLHLLIIAVVVGMIGPFLKQSDFVSIQLLYLISILIIVITLIFLNPDSWLNEWLFLVPISFILSIISASVYRDIWILKNLISRYENEESVDYLTGLGNVKEFDRYLNRTTELVTEQQQSMALLLIDIDGFKDVNDEYSHTAGDAVLKQMSQLLINYLPKDVKAFRNGGEEFSIILIDESLDSTIKLAESIRDSVQQSTFHLPNKDTIKLSVSIGVGYLTEEDNKSKRRVFKDADDMLHEAKLQGQNKVMFNPIIKL
ncbi:GGDEF domain-containing protein [Mammaliicoccus lentus]|uniref:GGDEF domain-containing protein n=1 Tax=Mammaliicoccus lentus TaxID=42858 RepID=A0AAX3W606_MAMLE|nr:GGDEF domain-containing protein [Mammaliicoccus lentus]WHI60731.1 GGDEF domain-containing protein [Mammaliicoccus lentus]